MCIIITIIIVTDADQPVPCLG